LASRGSETAAIKFEIRSTKFETNLKPKFQISNELTSNRCDAIVRPCRNARLPRRAGAEAKDTRPASLIARFDHLNFGHSCLFRISSFGFRIWFSNTNWVMGKAHVTSLLSLPSCQPEKGGRPRNVFSEHSGHSIRSREPVIRCAAGVRGGGASNQSLSRVPTLAEGASSNTSESHLFRYAKGP